MRKFVLKSEEIRANIIKYISDLPFGHEIRVREYQETRTLEQNAKMWAMLNDIAKQVVWYGEKLTAEEWKIVLTAGLKKQKAVPGIEGGFVVLGASTSKMSMKEMAEVIELAEHFGGLHEVKWSNNERTNSSAA